MLHLICHGTENLKNKTKQSLLYYRKSNCNYVPSEDLRLLPLYITYNDGFSDILLNCRHFFLFQFLSYDVSLFACLRTEVSNIWDFKTIYLLWHTVRNDRPALAYQTGCISSYWEGHKLFSLLKSYSKLSLLEDKLMNQCGTQMSSVISYVIS